MAIALLTEEILQLCARRSLKVEHDVAVGPYLAPLVIQAADPADIGKNVYIAVEPRHWSPTVVEHMAGWSQEYMGRLRNLTQVDYVAVVVAGQDKAPGGLTSLGELATFLNGFGPPHPKPSEPLAAETSHQPRIRVRGAPAPTTKRERELAGCLTAWTGTSVVFCAMPFKQEFDVVFFELIAPAVSDADLKVLRTDQEETLAAIDRRIHEGIAKADLVLADVTGHNPNVLYEVGVAHGKDKQTLLLRHDNRPLLFDVHNHETMDYCLEDCASSRQRLGERLNAAVGALRQR